MTDDEIQQANDRLLARRRREAVTFERAPMSFFEQKMAEREAERAADPVAFAKREAEAVAREEREAAESARLAAVSRSLASLRSADVDPTTSEAIAAASDAPPVVPGHAGSRDAADAVAGFLTDERRTLLLWGPTGHGKTWAALWPVAHHRASFVSAADIRPCAEWDTMRSRSTTALLLVFDELGAEPKGEWFAGEASRILTTRQTRGLKTIITTNIPPRITDVRADMRDQWRADVLKARYGDRLDDRLHDVTHGTVVRIQGDRSIRSMVTR